MRTISEDGTESLFSFSSKQLSVHAHVSCEEMGWVCLSFQLRQWKDLFRSKTGGL